MSVILPLFSIVIPVYNVNPAFLDQCINSILTQSFSDFEIILVDDGSTDSSGQLCDEFAAKDNRIRVIHKQNGGVSSARNEGISAAKGEWLLFCDADDTLQADCLQSVFKIIENGNNDIYKFQHSILNRDGTILKIQTEKSSRVVSNNEYLRLLLRHKIIGSCWGYVFKIKRIKDIRFNTSLTIGEDVLFVLNTLLDSSCSVFVSPLAIYNYRDNPESVSKDWHEIGLKIGIVNMLVKKLFEHYSALGDYLKEYNTFVIQNTTYVYLWKKRTPDLETQQFLKGCYKENYIVEEVECLMNRYIGYLRTNRHLGNFYLSLYFYKIRMATCFVRRWRSLLNITKHHGKC